MCLRNNFFSHTRSNNSSNQSTPTFNYFAAKLLDNNNLNELNKEARKYINEHYPDAKAGSSYYLNPELVNISPPDFYFIRAMTFRSCIPPYTDQQLDVFEKNAEDYVRQQLQHDVMRKSP